MHYCSLDAFYPSFEQNILIQCLFIVSHWWRKYDTVISVVAFLLPTDMNKPCNRFCISNVIAHNRGSNYELWCFVCFRYARIITVLSNSQLLYWCIFLPPKIPYWPTHKTVSLRKYGSTAGDPPRPPSLVLFCVYWPHAGEKCQLLAQNAEDLIISRSHGYLLVWNQPQIALMLFFGGVHKPKKEKKVRETLLNWIKAKSQIGFLPSGLTGECMALRWIT